MDLIQGIRAGAPSPRREPAEAEGSRRGASASRRAATILVIDDSPSSRRALGSILQRAGFRVAEAATGQEGIAHLAARPDLVILDIELPDMRGPDVCRVIKASPLTALTPVLEISAARITNFDHATGLEQGADAYLPLPVDPGVLIATVRCLLRMRAALSRLDRLHALTASLAGAADAGAIAAVLLDHTVAAADADGGAVALLDADGASLEISAELGPRPSWLPPPPSADPGLRRIPVQRPYPLIICAWTGEPIWIETAEAYASAYPHLARAAREGARPAAGESIEALAAVPLVLEGRAVGALALWFSEPRAFPEAERAFLATIAQHGAQALDRARLLQAEREARERAERAIEQERRSSRAREEIIAVVSHDLRNPLQLVAMGAHLIQHQAPHGDAGEPIRRHADRVLRAADRMNGLIRDLLDAASIEAGAFQIEVAAHPLRGLVSDALDAVTPLATEKRIELQRDLADLVADCDRDRVLQALVNLLTNAVKFTPERGTIRVTASAHGSGVEFSVADTGPGIPEGQIATLFDRYVRQSRSTGGGTGLGLYITKAIAEAHGGTLGVASQPGKGATFSLYLPRARPTSLALVDV